MKERDHVRTRSNDRAGLTLILSFIVIVSLIGGAWLVLGCGAARPQVSDSAAAMPESGAPEFQEVDLIMDWIPWVLDIPVDVAQAKGFYRDQGLRVHQTVPAEATDVAKFVATGKSQFGLYYSPDVLMAADAGASLLSVGALMSHAPVGLALKPGFSADSPTALRNKVVSVPLIPSTRASLSSMLAAAGIDSSSVKVVDPGFELVAPLLSGKVDAAAFTEFGELVQGEMQGQKLVFMDFRDWGTPDYAFLDIVTGSDFAEHNPKTTRAFVRATLEGLEYAAAHPEEAVALYAEAHPELDAGLLSAQWKAAVPFLARSSAVNVAGWQDLNSWKELSTWMEGSGLISRPVDAANVVTNDYLP
jgi:ABC-type nitrate/sulfonate/bicarbonate transport system substrate-binding protein